MNAKAQAAANVCFDTKKVLNIYAAFSVNKSDRAQGPGQVKEPFPTPGVQLEWTSKLLRGKKRAYESPVGKPATTKATLLEVGGDGILQWRLEPVTGRSHQLRFELYKRGFPILGDILYGSAQKWPEGIALRAARIFFPPEAKKFGLADDYSLPRSAPFLRTS
jgi:tRNA pseudouridine32 synthase/23S rRNA pseudouridine746 synthase